MRLEEIWGGVESELVVGGGMSSQYTHTHTHTHMTRVHAIRDVLSHRHFRPHCVHHHPYPVLVGIPYLEVSPPQERGTSESSLLEPWKMPMATSRPAAKEAREVSPEAVAVAAAGVAGVAGVAAPLASAVPSRRLWRRVARAVWHAERSKG